MGFNSGFKGLSVCGIWRVCHQLGTGVLYTTELYHHLKFVSTRVSYIVLRGHWC